MSRSRSRSPAHFDPTDYGGEAAAMAREDPQILQRQRAANESATMETEDLHIWQRQLERDERRAIDKADGWLEAWLISIMD